MATAPHKPSLQDLLIKVGDNIYSRGKSGKVKEIKHRGARSIFVLLDDTEIEDDEDTVKIPEEGIDAPEYIALFNLVLDEERDAAYAGQFLFSIRPYDFEKEENILHI